MTEQEFQTRLPPELQARVDECKATDFVDRGLMVELDHCVEIKWPGHDWVRILDNPTHPDGNYMVNVRHKWVRSKRTGELAVLTQQTFGTTAVN